ncbi:MAG: TM0106 family RecB-like putative nuclease, partial [Thermocrispum sp.]
MHREMRDDGERLVLSPTDLTRHLACGHITTLDLQVARGSRPKPGAADEALELIFRLGLEHEERYLARLTAEGRTVVELPTVFGHERQLAAEAETVRAMRSGADVVYQATLYDGRWGGQADFLLKVDRPSELGPHSYEIADTKLARRMKVPALLQMATYAERLAELQGVEPERIYVVTGDGVSRPWRLVDVAAYARRARARLRAAVEHPAATEPVPVPYCAQCRWSPECQQQWRENDDLSLVAFMRVDHRITLHDNGFRTLRALAEC